MHLFFPPQSRLHFTTGHVTAHHCCAAWSDGVVQKEDLGLCNVDKAVFAGLSQVIGTCALY